MKKAATNFKGFRSIDDAMKNLFWAKKQKRHVCKWEEGILYCFRAQGLNTTDFVQS
jgi:hypothetical protein